MACEHRAYQYQVMVPEQTVTVTGHEVLHCWEMVQEHLTVMAPPSAVSSTHIHFYCKNCSYKYAYGCAQVLYTKQHRTVLLIFTLIHQSVGWLGKV